ncbi:MAG: DUF6161 domain-containing protein [Crocinitomicaceae bacterium]
MTTAEIKRIIADSTDPSWFNSIESTITFSKVGFSQIFTGVSTIHRFLSQQIRGYEKYEDIPGVLDASKQHFANVRTQLENFVNSYKTHAAHQLNNGWRNIQSNIQSDGNRLTYNSPQAIFLIDLNKVFPNYVQGAYNYIIGSINFNSRDNFNGGVLAYEFELKDYSNISKRRDKEKASLTKLKNDFIGQLNDSENQLTEHLNNSKKDYKEYLKKIDGFKAEKEKIFQDWFEGDKDTEAIGVKEMFDNFKAEKERVFSNWFTGNSENEIIGVKDEFNNFKQEQKDAFNLWFEGSDANVGAKKKVDDLEHTYEELLRLKKPAEYWRTRAVELKSEGWKAIKWLVMLVIFACVTLYLLLWLTPEGMLLSFVKGNAQAIKWSIVYVTFISFLAYGIRALNKVAFSSFHLARDAEEKEQLTYVYLALIKESAVDIKDKNLILQSLFSRADTGLLKDDSGPTMPNDISGKFFGK